MLSRLGTYPWRAVVVDAESSQRLGLTVEVHPCPAALVVPLPVDKIDNLSFVHRRWIVVDAGWRRLNLGVRGLDDTR
jgi:hypothetical protein